AGARRHHPHRDGAQAGRQADRADKGAGEESPHRWPSAVQPGVAHRARSGIAAHRGRMLGGGGARAHREPRRTHARRPSVHGRHVGQGERRPAAQGRAPAGEPRAAARDAERPEGAVPGAQVMPTFTMQVFRGDARGGDFKEYRVEVEPGMVVLDVIHRIQATQAHDLAVRWNCKAGKCGSAESEINGKPRLMCMTRMDLFSEGEPISVAPIRGFPSIRDLVTDVSYNYVKAKQGPPLRPKPPEPGDTYRSSQGD